MFAVQLVCFLIPSNSFLTPRIGFGIFLASIWLVSVVLTLLTLKRQMRRTFSVLRGCEYFFYLFAATWLAKHVDLSFLQLSYAVFANLFVQLLSVKLFGSMNYCGMTIAFLFELVNVFALFFFGSRLRWLIPTMVFVIVQISLDTYELKKNYIKIELDGEPCSDFTVAYRVCFSFEVFRDLVRKKRDAIEMKKADFEKFPTLNEKNILR